MIQGQEIRDYGSGFWCRVSYV